MEISQSSGNVAFNSIGVRSGINKSRVAAWLSLVAKNEDKQILSLNYTFCNDEYLFDINRRYLNHDYYTDIITFDLSDNPSVIEGDIYISIDRVRENAQANANTIKSELNRVVAHGLLHLCGYKDKTKKEINEMRKKEEYYLEMLSQCFT